jgi:putative oxidoreductase
LTKIRCPIARTSSGAIFFIVGLTKIFSFAGVAGWIASSGLPFAKLLLVLTIAIEVGAGLLLIIGRQTRWAALALAFVVPTMPAPDCRSSPRPRGRGTVIACEYELS